MKLITGYQYGDQNKLIGEYQFPMNLDSDQIHLPPNTTLKKPPQEDGKTAYFIDDNWVLRDNPVLAKTEEQFK